MALFGFAKGMDIIPGVIFTALDFISSIVSIACLILILFLLFRPGNPGDNQYGVNPIGTKIGFFG